MNTIFEKFLDLFFPRSCLGCKKEGGFLCTACGKKLDDLKPHDIFSTEFLDEVFIACEYGNDNLIGKLIKRVKYKFSGELTEKLAEIVVRNLTGIVNFDGVLIPVPLSKKRMNWRGFNQAELIGRKVVDKLNADNLHVDATLLRKIRETKQQVECKSRAERIINVRGVFQVNPAMSPPRRVILFDDVYTTGTTLNECAKALKKAGVKKVIGLAIAKKQEPPKICDYSRKVWCF